MRFSISDVWIIDGSGAEPFFGGVTVTDGRIERIDRHFDEKVEKVRGWMEDASELPSPSSNTGSAVNPAPRSQRPVVLCPGFIDIHTHADLAVLYGSKQAPALLQGVTTEVFSNCGLGFCPCDDAALSLQRRYIGGLFGPDAGLEWNWRSVGDYLSCLRHGIAVNAAYLFPHGAVRVSVLAMADRAAGSSEIERMMALAERSMDEGAMGMSSGLAYAPMAYSSREECIALSRVVGRRGGIWAVHLREYEDNVMAALEEAIGIAGEAGVPLHVSHLQVNGKANWGKSIEMLDRIDRARASGIDVTADSYPYTAGSTLLQALLPGWANAGGPDALRDRLHSKEESLRIQRSLDDLAGNGFPWETYRLSGIPEGANSGLEGRSVAEAARILEISPSEVVIRLLTEEDLRVCYIRHGACEDDLRHFLAYAHQMVGSDGLHVAGKPHPRLWGTFPRVLSRYAREEHLLTPQAAIQKMTGAPAARLGLVDRGVLRVGAAADLVLLDWDGVRDAATFDDPTRPPDGIRSVWVNGRLTVDGGSIVSHQNGTVLTK